MTLSVTDLPLCENCVGLKVTQRTGDVQNVLSIFQVVLERKWTTLALTETCGHHAIIESNRIHAEMP